MFDKKKVKKCSLFLGFSLEFDVDDFFFTKLILHFEIGFLLHGPVV